MRSSRFATTASVLIVACILIASGCNLFMAPKDSFDEGERLYSDGNYRRAIARFNDAIKNSKHPEAGYYRWRASAHESLGEHREAIADYTEAIHLGGSQTTTAGDYEGRGDVQLKLGDHLKQMEEATNSGTHDSAGFYQKAIEDYSKAIMLNPADSATAYANRGTAYFRLNYYSLALVDYDRAISQKPDRPLTYISRGRALYFLQKYQQSLENLSTGIDRQVEIARASNIKDAKLKPFYANAYHFRSQTYDKLGRHDLALTDEKKAETFGYRTGG
jgi:tetratricopeptide (TPR) repeat protein